MLSRAGHLSPTLKTSTSLFSFLNKTPIFLLNYAKLSSSPLHLQSLPSKPLSPTTTTTPQFPKSAQHLSTAAALINESMYNNAGRLSLRMRKKMRRESPEGQLMQKLCICAKDYNVEEALMLYDAALINGVALSAEHFDKLLYLCSSGYSNLGLERGFEIYKQMSVSGVAPTEATFTSLARLAAAKEDPEMAFDLVKEMKRRGLLPKLRSYVPALFGFCKSGLADKAYEVDAYMLENGILAEEAELRELLAVSSKAKRAEKVYEMIQRLRCGVRQVCEETAVVVEDWFRSEKAGEVGEVDWDAGKVREGVLKGGGGWHGQGWLGSGKWDVVRTEMDRTGVCLKCSEKLLSIDIDPRETENFASSLSTLACKKEVKADFLQFQEWLQKNGPFDAVVDGANVGLVDHHGFNFSQLNSAVKLLREMSPSKRLPLIILHRNRVTIGPAQNPKNQKLLQFWKNSGALYSTPQGSNDDWYWLYAAVSCKCLLLTNDEMRDHLFQLLGTSFFPRWKEKHQVRLSVTRDGLSLHMPPPYSIVIQESEKGSWHIPTITEGNFNTRRKWICATRTRDIFHTHVNKGSNSPS